MSSSGSDSFALTPRQTRDALAALPEVTEVLALEFARAGTPEPDWPGWKWGVARAVVTIHGMAGMLATRSGWSRTPHWREFLQAQRDHIAARQRKVAQLLEVVGQEASAAGLRAVALKGAALAALDLAPPGSRPLADLDLLADAADRNQWVTILRKLGYRQLEDSWKHLAFEPVDSVPCSEFGEHANRAIGVDLHFSVRELLAGRPVDITAEIPAESSSPGLAGYRSPVALLRHLLLHAAANLATRWVRAIQLQDIALLATRFGAADWDRFLDAGRAEANRWWQFAPLALTERYWPGTFPTEILESIAADCGALHRHGVRKLRIYDVSACNPRLLAFPELIWARSLDGAFRYCWQRIFPPREALDSYAQMTQRSDFAANVSWFGASQKARMLRWLVDRPPRPATYFMITGGVRSQFDATEGKGESARP